MIYFSLAIALILLAVQIFKNDIFKKNAVSIFVLNVFLVFAISFIFSFSRFYYMLHDAQSKYMLPPYQGWDYINFSSFRLYFLPYVISFIASILFLISAKALNKRSGERFFEKEEVAIAGTAIFLSGYPGVLIYLFSLVGMYLVTHVMSLAIKKRNEPISLYYFWLPTTIFAIIIIEFLLKTFGFWGKITI